MPNIEGLVVARIEQLERATLDPTHGERARVMAQELIGSARIIEDGEQIVAEIGGGRLLMLGAALDATYGAQEQSRGLLSIRARR